MWDLEWFPSIWDTFTRFSYWSLFFYQHISCWEERLNNCLFSYDFLILFILDLATISTPERLCRFFNFLFFKCLFFSNIGDHTSYIDFLTDALNRCMVFFECHILRFFFNLGWYDIDICESFWILRRSIYLLLS